MTDHHPRNRRRLSPAKIALGAALLGLASMPAQARAQAQDSGTVVVDDDGTVHIPPMSIPVSSFLSDSGKAYITQHLKDMQNPQSKVMNDGEVLFFMEPFVVSMKAQFPLEKKDIEIAGVKGLSYTPLAGITAAHKDKILLNLHGGGFMGCYPGCAELESMPIASLGSYKVITIDYREGFDHKFPEASEDVAAVYRELLKTYKPENIGIYGCSAGGMLVGMSLAWFEKEGLPMPGGAGVFCAGMTIKKGAGFGGDSDYIVSPIGEANMPAEPPPPLGKGLPPIPYFADVDTTDPLVAPANSLEMLSKFPPTLFITATRGFELSSAVYSHGRMVKAGADAELHVWDGLFHGFFYNPDVPESRDAYDVIVNFFERHLGNKLAANHQ